MEFGQKRLNTKEDPYRTIIETAHDLIWILDTKGNFTFFNKRCEETSGYGLSDLIDNNFAPLIHPEDLPKVQEVFLKTLQGNPQSYEVRAYDRNGKMFVLSVNTAPLYEKNKIIGTVSFGRDITENKKMEETLRENEVRYRRLVDYSPYGIGIHSEGKIVYINLAGMNILGATKPEELIGESIFRVIHPDFHETVKERIRMEEEGKIAPPEHEIFIRLDGTPVDVEMVAIPFTYNGKPAMYGVFRDITERKKLEEVRRENERLLLASKAKADIFAILSHEIRTPLTSIIGFTEVLKDAKMAGELNEKQTYFVEKILASSSHLLLLIDDLLDLSKVESGKLELVTEKFSVPEIINEAIALIGETATKRGIIIKKEFESFYMKADKRRFKQIVLNLLSNAVKFSKPEGGTVTIVAKKSGDVAHISVSDTGIGIKKEDLGRLFWAFEQIESGISRKYGGTGLGLAISKRLVELHGGTIKVESIFGKGSTFTILLPLK
jgi:PAS domain S-box-containing protein